MWPDRAEVPSIRDIAAFWEALPSDIPPGKVGELTGTRFVWDSQNTVTSQRYVQGVVAAHNHTKRVMIDELRKLFEEKPANPEDALRKWQSISEWVKIQRRPPTPTQFFDD